MTKIWTGCKTWLGQGQDAFDINNPPVPPDSTEQGCPVTTYGSWDADDPDEALLMGPAERADVIVDFTGFENGTSIRMINTAPDAPFGGFPDVPADPGTTGQVMQFVVNAGAGQPGRRSQYAAGHGSGSSVPTRPNGPRWRRMRQ